MTDTFSKDERSRIMTKVKSKNTGAERIVFTFLRKQKVYFQKHYKRVVGTPDIALPRKKKAVFIDSAFWHGKKYDVILRNRPPDDYWVRKIARNMERDKQQRSTLRAEGWRLLVVWEDDIKRVRTRQETLIIIKNFLLNDG